MNTPININLTVINDQPVWKIIPKIKKAVPAVSIIPTACILEKTSGNLNKPKLPPMPGKAMVIAQNKEMSWNDADGNVHVMVKKMPVDEQAIVMEQKGNIKILKLNDDGDELDINIAFDGDLSDLSDYQNKFPHQLSGGEQQRVCIARAIVKNPELILADEPTGNLDPAAAHKILKILEQINKEGTSIIMATHNYKLISDKDYRIIELKEGSLVSSW